MIINILYSLYIVRVIIYYDKLMYYSYIIMYNYYILYII